CLARAEPLHQIEPSLSSTRRQYRSSRRSLVLLYHHGHRRTQTAVANDVGEASVAKIVELPTGWDATERVSNLEAVHVALDREGEVARDRIEQQRVVAVETDRAL